MKKKKHNKIREKIRRDIEIKSYGKLVSLRPSIIFKSRKDYNRKDNKIDKRDLDED